MARWTGRTWFCRDEWVRTRVRAAQAPGLTENLGTRGLFVTLGFCPSSNTREGCQAGGAAGRFHVALKGTLGPRTQVAQRQLWTQHRELWSHQGRAVMAKAPVQRWGSPLSGRVSGGGSAAAPRALLQLRGPCSWADRGSRGRTGGAAPLGPQNKSPQGPSGLFFSTGLR